MQRPGLLETHGQIAGICTVCSWLTSHDISDMCVLTCIHSLTCFLSVFPLLCLAQHFYSTPGRKIRPRVVQLRGEWADWLIRGCQHTTAETTRNERNMSVTEGSGHSEGVGLLAKGLIKCSPCPLSELEGQGSCLRKSEFSTSNRWRTTKTPPWQ